MFTLVMFAVRQGLWDGPAQHGLNPAVGWEWLVPDKTKRFLKLNCIKIKYNIDQNFYLDDAAEIAAARWNKKSVFKKVLIIRII